MSKFQSAAVIFIAEPLSAMQTKTGKGNPAGTLIEHYAAALWDPVIPAVNAESVQVFAAPVEGSVENVVKFGEARFAGDQQASPD